MKRSAIVSAVVAATVLSISGFAATQSVGDVQSLRSGELTQQLDAPEKYKQDAVRFTRNYRQQPPLISHKTDKYQIDLKANRCISCHDWSTSAEEEAPTMSMTHYLDRDGNQLDTVSGSRWFCNQCHVPQLDAPELIENVFEASSGN